MLPHRWSLKHYASWKKPDAKDHSLYDSIYTNYPEKANLILFFLGHPQGMQKFLGQGSKPCHSSTPSHCSENARSLTCKDTRDLQKRHIYRGRKQISSCLGLEAEAGIICKQAQWNFLGWWKWSKKKTRMWWWLPALLTYWKSELYMYHKWILWYIIYAVSIKLYFKKDLEEFPSWLSGRESDWEPGGHRFDPWPCSVG